VPIGGAPTESSHLVYFKGGKINTIRREKQQHGGRQILEIRRGILLLKGDNQSVLQKKWGDTSSQRKGERKGGIRML